MIVILSYLLAVILTLAMAIILYPIAAVFWVIGLFGRISDSMFAFTTKTISKLWQDLKDISREEEDDSPKWQCVCGHMNSGRFCSECGAAMPVFTTNEAVVNEDNNTTLNA